MFTSSRAHDKRADRFDDIASAVQAGLDVRAILTGPVSSGLRGAVRSDLDLVAALVARGLDLDDLDHAILSAAEIAGDLPRALHERAVAHRFVAELQRELAQKLAYPCFLLGFAALVVGWLAMLGFAGVGGAAVAAIVILACALAGGTTYLVRRVRNDPEFDGRWLPGLRELLRDLGEVPYLTALRGLYGAGVLLPVAHATAARTCRVAWLRRRLEAAQPRLELGEPFTESLTATGALGVESAQLLASAEVVGELEASLTRAAERRSDTFRRRVRRIARAVGVAAYALAVGVVVYVVFSFYSGMYSHLR